MYVDGYMLLAIYSIAVLALGVSVYALWTLKEVEEIYKKKTPAQKSITVIKQSKRRV